MNIDGKVAVITGASKGIGRKTAELFLKNGAKVAVSARSQPLLKELEEQYGKEKVFVFTGDMSKEKDIINFIKESAEFFSEIHILVNNSGIGIFRQISETNTDDWDKMFNLNVRGLFIATRESLPFLRKNKNSVIINVASLAGKNPVQGAAGYSATKHAVVGFSRALLLEERKNGIRVLTICPGSVNTHFFTKETENFKPKNPEKILQAEDVARTILNMIELPDNATISEIDMRPANP